ncbi:MAG: PKD domain-containing protein, partial [Synergistaceae bacterium]|nr:PKD domain-containing protein [Synergistaceae bacterium]
RGRAGGRVYNNTEVDPNFVPPLTLTGTFGSGVKGAAYSGSATVSGGTAPYTWKYSGVPDGLKVTISGTSKNKITLSNKPTKAQSYSFKVTATDKNGVAATKTFTIKVTQPASKLAFSGSFTDGFVDEYYSRTLKVSGGTEPYTWSKTGTGTWPTGLKLSKTSTGATLKLYGTPSKAGKYKFTLAVTDSKGVSASKTFTINISEEEFEDIDFSVASAKSFSIKKVLNGANSFLYNSVVEETPNAEQEADRSFSVANTSLKVLSDDILKQGEGRDEDLVDVRANEPVRFMIGEWLDANGAKAEVSSEDVYIYIDDKPVEDIIVSDEGLFTVPADFVHDDFKVQAIAETATKRLETIELFMSAIE